MLDTEEEGDPERGKKSERARERGFGHSLLRRRDRYKDRDKDRDIDRDRDKDVMETRGIERERERERARGAYVVPFRFNSSCRRHEAVEVLSLPRKHVRYFPSERE